MPKLNSQIFFHFIPISLEEMGKVKLMNRMDTKFVTTISKINLLLETAANDYFIQEIDGQFNMPYYTCYFDTPDVNMYYQHQRGKKSRQKIRIRNYEGSSSLPFLEIKKKDNHGRTRKKRIPMEEGTQLLDYADFINDNSLYNQNDLAPKIENHFFRVTLVNKDMTERITIDSGLEFHNLSNSHHLTLDDIGIIEWKRDALSCNSGLKNLLLDLRIHQSGFSKYCMGMAMTNPELRQNRVKKRIRFVEKLRNFD